MRRNFKILIAGAVLAACSSKPSVPPPPTVDAASLRTVENGQLVGFAHSENAAHVWRSVPFAAPPVGDLRWRAPRPAGDWQGVREALDHAPWCPQIRGRLDDGSSADAIPIGSVMGQEDCLYMNLYAPTMTAQAAESAKLPVMMWIHGGSNVWGRAEQYDPSALAARHNVIVAVVQYRLGPLGWFAHDAVQADAETRDDRSANFANLDQIAALEWLRDNAAAFGGDPDNVTVFGESAGGHNVVTLLGSPRAKGLFHRAIVQSGNFRSESVEYAQTGTGEASHPVVAKWLGEEKVATGAALRAVPLDTVFAAYDPEEGDGIEPPRIIEDGIVVRKGGLRAAFSSPETFNAVPVLTGTNRDELKLFNVFNPELVRFRFGRLPKARDAELYEAASEYQSRMWRYSSVDSPAKAMTAGGHTDVYAYRFDWDEEGSVFGSNFAQLFGAAHSFEIPFVFGQFKFLGQADRWVFTKKNEAGRIALSDAMMSYWANFAKTGAPGQGVNGELATWHAWSNDADKPNIMVFDSPADGGSRMLTHHETSDDIINGIFTDVRIPDNALRCRLYEGAQYWNPELAEGEDGRCG